MSRRKIKAGSTSIAVPIFIQDTSSSVGAGLGSLVYNSSGLAARYRREGQSSWTTITLVTATLGTFTSGGFITAGSITGKYEVGIPDAAFAAGAKWVEIEYYGATNMLPVLLEFELDLIDYQDSIRAGLTALPPYSPGTYSGIVTAGSNGGVRLNSDGVNDAGSGVWNANPSSYSGVNTFGRELQPIYYADIKWDYDYSNTRDEYSVNWFRGNVLLNSGLVSSPIINVVKTSDGTNLITNQRLDYTSFGSYTTRYNESSNLITAGEPYNVIVSGTIDGNTRVWQKIVSRHKLS